MDITAWRMTDLFLTGEYGELRRNMVGYFIEDARLLIQQKWILIPPPLILILTSRGKATYFLYVRVLLHRFNRKS